MDSDVAIIGGGFAGCATAWWLGRRGVRAIVLEREPMLGRYASGRSAGLGRQLVEDDASTTLTVRGANLLRAHVAHAWRETGGILSFDDAGVLAAYVARAGKFAIPVEKLDASNRDAGKSKAPRDKGRKAKDGSNNGKRKTDGTGGAEKTSTTAASDAPPVKTEVKPDPPVEKTKDERIRAASAALGGCMPCISAMAGKRIDDHNIEDVELCLAKNKCKR